jgi:hypothetical protein
MVLGFDYERGNRWCIAVSVSAIRTHGKRKVIEKDVSGLGKAEIHCRPA